MDNADWSAFPNTSSAKLWIGPGDTVRNALRLYNPSSWQGKLIKQAYMTLPENVSRMLLPHPNNKITTELDRTSKQLWEISKLHNANISYYTGTPGPHRKRTAQITNEGHVTLYAKIGDTNPARKLITREHEALALLASLTPPFSVPKASGCIEDSKGIIALQTAPDYNNIGVRGPALLEADMTALTWLSAKHQSHMKLPDLLERHNVIHMVNDLASRDKSCKQTLQNAITFLNNTFQKQEVQTCLAHGDYTPWNTLEQGKTGLYIFDWEYARTDMPALFDLFHFIFMPTRLVSGYPPADTISGMIDRLTRLSSYSFVNSIKEKELLIPYILLYLLVLLSRDFEAGTQPDNYLVSCIHILLLKSGYTDEPYRVLVEAYACDPEEGSEPGVGWNMVNAITGPHEAWVITRSNNRTAIETALTRQPRHDLHFIYVDLPRWAAFWKKGGRGIRTYYYLWQLLAWFRARRLTKKIDFDLAHHVTFVNDWLYSFIPLTPLPAVWGPIGSHPYIPFSLRMDFTTYIRDRLRYGFQAFMRFADPLFWLCTFRSRLIIGIEKGVVRRLPPAPRIRKRFIAHTAIGVESLPPPKNTNTQNTQGLQVLCVGRMVTIKGLHITLMAFSHLVRRHTDAKLKIIGKGPLKDRLIRLAHELSISDSVEFVDWLPRNDVIATMRQADVFLFPSFEGGGMVVLEAMANQVPVVCLNYGGPGQMVGDDCGFKIPPSSLKSTVRELGEALCFYCDNPLTLQQHGLNARQHVEKHYLWSNRSAAIDSWYREVDRHQSRARRPTT